MKRYTSILLNASVAKAAQISLRNPGKGIYHTIAMPGKKAPAFSRSRKEESWGTRIELVMSSAMERWKR